MTNEKIEAKVREIIRERLPLTDDYTIEPTANLVSDLGADSLDIVELAMALEDEFDVEIPDDMAGEINTVDAVVKFVTSRYVEKRGATA